MYMINWERLYNKLLEERVSTVGEEHHVIPKHAKGRDSDGIVILPRRYHILAHYIRWRWKGEIGDKIAYKMMSGQVINPMLDLESRERIMSIIKEYWDNPIHIKKQSEKAVERWLSEDYRSKVKESKTEWMSLSNNRVKCAAPLNTKQARDKAKASILGYYEVVDKELLSSRAKKAAETTKKLYSEEEISKFKSRPGNKNGMYNKGYLNSGKSSGKWNGIAYFIEKDGKVTEYDNKRQLQSKFGISSLTILKYADSGLIIERGVLKGSKLFTKKYK